MINNFKIPKFWDDEYTKLTYINEDFNDDENVQRWLEMGFPNKFTGDMADMRGKQPSWNHGFIEIFKELGWKDIGTSYYRMMPGSVLPTHKDLYKKYIGIHQLQGQETSIRRAVVFLEDWQSGHYAEYEGRPFTNWQAGAAVEWQYDAPHLAANMGVEPRYTLQITGHV
jgi:hypothetical protein